MTMNRKPCLGSAFSTLWGCAAIGALAAAGPAAQAASQCESSAGNLVTNCGFESFVNPLRRPSAWSTGGSGIASVLAGYEHTGSGSLGLNFDTPGSAFASQVVGGAGTYNVSFWLDLYSSGVPTNLAPTLSVTFGDQTLSINLPVTNTQNQNYRFFQFNNVTTATPAELKFQTSGNAPAGSIQYFDFFVDDVVVTSVATAVPEPSSLALALGGLAGLALWRGRQQRGHAAARALRPAAA